MSAVDSAPHVVEGQEVRGPAGGPARAARVAFYSHDSFGLGHFRRNLHLAWALHRSQPEVELMMVTGSPRATSFDLPPGVRLVKLPAVSKDEEGRYVTRGMGTPLEDTVRLRKAVIRSAVLSFAPDIFVVDHTPVGLRGELLPLLGDLRHRTSTRLVFGMRDVIDEPPRVIADWGRQGIYRILEALYHHVWVYGSSTTFPVESCYALPAEVVAKLEYRGYLGRRPRAESPVCRASAAFSDPRRPHVLCLLGGGEDGIAVARAFIDMTLLRSESWNATLVTGPFLARGERHDLAARAAGSAHVQVLRFTSDIERLIAGSDAVVTMGGYNSIMEAVSLGKRTLVIPRVHPRREQILRAVAFQRLGLVQLLEPSALTAESLAASTATLLAGAAPPNPSEVGLEWDGSDDFATRINDLLNGIPEDERLRDACEHRARA